MTSILSEEITNYGHPHTDGFLVMRSPLEEEVVYIDELFPILIFYEKSETQIKKMMPDEAIEKLNNGYFNSYNFLFQKEVILRLLMEGMNRYSIYGKNRSDNKGDFT